MNTNGPTATHTCLLVLLALGASSTLAQLPVFTDIPANESAPGADLIPFHDAIDSPARQFENEPAANTRFTLNPVVNTVSACDNGCYCITWTFSSGAYVEVRCPGESTSRSGWSHDGGPADGSSGSWTGDGRQTAPPDPLPGMPVTGLASNHLTQAKGAATTRLRGTLADTHIFEPDACTELFANSPLEMRGIDVLSSIIWRDGTGVKDANNYEVCSSADAWTMIPSNGQHARVVFICPGNFNVGDKNRRAVVLIHEALHVAGQVEDKTGTVGPEDPPTTAQITANVKAACGL